MLDVKIWPAQHTSTEHFSLEEIILVCDYIFQITLAFVFNIMHFD
jgi:hypothetical protein